MRATPDDLAGQAGLDHEVLMENVEPLATQAFRDSLEWLEPKEDQDQS